MSDPRELLENLRTDPDRLQRKLIAGRIGLWSVSITPESQTLAVCPGFMEEYGYVSGEISTDWAGFVSALVHPDDGQYVGETLFAACVQNIPLQMEFRLWSQKESSWRWVFVFGSTDFLDPERGIYRVSGGAQDVTEKEEARRTLQAQSQSLARSLESSTSLLDKVQLQLEGLLQGERPGVGYEVQLARLFTAAGAEPPLAKGLGGAFDALSARMVWYKAILDSLPFPVSVSNMNGCWTYLNGPALDILGLPDMETALGTDSTLWDSRREGAVSAASEEAKHFSFYHEGLDRFYQGQSSPLFDQVGTCIGRIEAMQDVTDTHTASEHTHLMLDATPMACTIWDDSFNIVDCNLEATRLFEVADKQTYLDNFFRFSPAFQPDGRPSLELIRLYVGQAIEEGTCRFEWMHQKLNGESIPCEVFLERGALRNRTLVLGYVRDLREMRAKQAELDQERDLLRQVMDSSPVCFLILVEGIVRFATPHARQFLGIDVGDNVADFYEDDSQRLAFFTELRHSGAVNWRVVAMRGVDGAGKEMLANAFLADYYGESCVMSWFLDVTEMREKERELRLARDAAEESTRAKSDFLANMSHEIRTPMNAILGLTKLVLETPLEAQQREYLQKAESSAKALLRILNDILDFSKIEAGKLEMEKVPFSPAEVAGNVVGVYSSNAAAKGLTLSLDVAEDVPAYIKGDPLRLNQVLTNLTGNALKFTEDGGIFLSIALVHDSVGENVGKYIECGCSASGDEGAKRPAPSHSVLLRFVVRDTGIGIPPEKCKKLFTAFSQADTSTTRKYGGTGLGLAISKTLVTMMEGQISCSPVDPHGTEFSFTARFQALEPDEVLPAPAHHGNVSVPELDDGETPEMRVEHLKGARILVAEDNEINQIIAREVLGKAGLHVDIANNGREAVQKVVQGSYDLVFMDIQMPEMDGFSATAELRRYSRLRGLPIVAMTAHAMIGDREKSLAMGMNDHITKPLDATVVFSTIARWVAAPRENAEASSVAPQEESPFAPLPQASEQAAPPTPFNTPGRTVTAAPAEVSPGPIVHSSEVKMDPSALPDFIDGVDIATGLTRVANNKKLFKRLLLQVADDSVAQREKLTAAVMGGDMSAVREVAHSLKGASGNLAITRVYESSMALEMAAKSEDFAQVFTNLDALEQALDAYMLAVQPLRG